MGFRFSKERKKEGEGGGERKRKKERERMIYLTQKWEKGVGLKVCTSLPWDRQWPGSNLQNPGPWHALNALFWGEAWVPSSLQSNS